MSHISIKNIKKIFEHTTALEDVSLTIEDGSFFTLLGPSGCGKTTLLRILAGFVEPDEGSIWLGDQELTHIPAEKREIGMVFQNYALFPHMNVYDNIAYGLKIKKYLAQEIKENVQGCLRLVRLEGYEDRKVHELSGGEQQRVALARALITRPKVLVLDEPLSNLDARLRDQMRQEIKRIQRELGIITLFVTHDQKEALTMSDQIAVFNQGQCIQVGTPQEIYNNPKSMFVAQFVGQTNLFSQEQAKEIGILENVREECVSVMVRPEHIQMKIAGKGIEEGYKGYIEEIEFNGSLTEYKVKIANRFITILQMNTLGSENLFKVGQNVMLIIPPQSIKILRG